SNMTSKGQVTVPADMRRALGLKPGEAVQWEFDGADGIRSTKADEEANKAQLRADFLKRLKKAQEISRRADTVPGISTDDFMALIREPLQPFEIDRGKLSLLIRTLSSI